MLLQQDQDDIIEEFLEGQPRADYWRELRQALAGRLSEASSHLATLSFDTFGYAEARARVEELQEQVHALGTEEVITRFVEESVSSTVNRPRRIYLPEGLGDIDDDEFAIDAADVGSGRA